MSRITTMMVENSAQLSMDKSILDKSENVQELSPKLVFSEMEKTQISLGGQASSTDKTESTGKIERSSTDTFADAEELEPISNDVEKIERKSIEKLKIKPIGAERTERISADIQKLERTLAEVKVSEVLSSGFSGVQAVISHYQTKVSIADVETPAKKRESEVEPQQPRGSEQTDNGQVEANSVDSEKPAPYARKPYIAEIQNLSKLTPKKCYDLKIIVVGDSGVGKTSLVKRYTDRCFCGTYRITIGIDFFNKNIKSDYGPVLLRIYDIAGQDRSTQLSRAFYRKANGVIVCYDLSNHITLSSVAKWLTALDNAACAEDCSNLPRVLLGNKCDLSVSRKQSRNDMVQYAQDNQFGAWFEVSAETGQNVTEAFTTLVKMMLAMEVRMRNVNKEQDENIIDLGSKSETKDTCAFGKKCS